MIKKSDLIEMLLKKEILLTQHEHAALFSVEDSKEKRGIIDGAHTKNLFLKNKKNYFCLFSCEEKSQVDLKNFSNLSILILSCFMVSLCLIVTELSSKV